MAVRLKHCINQSHVALKQICSPNSSINRPMVETNEYFHYLIKLHLIFSIHHFVYGNGKEAIAHIMEPETGDFSVKNDKGFAD